MPFYDLKEPVNGIYQLVIFVPVEIDEEKLVPSLKGKLAVVFI